MVVNAPMVYGGRGCTVVGMVAMEAPWWAWRHRGGLGGHGCAMVDGSHRHTMLAWWPWRYHGKMHSGHGHTLVAWWMVAVEVAWWMVAVDTAWCMVAVDTP